MTATLSHFASNIGGVDPVSAVHMAGKPSHGEHGADDKHGHSGHAEASVVACVLSGLLCGLLMFVFACGVLRSGTLTEACDAPL